MTDIEALIARLEGLMAKATEAPWHLSEKGFARTRTPTLYATDEDLRYIARFHDGPCFSSPTPNLDNARLAGESVNALPTLIAHIRALSGAVEAEHWQPIETAPYACHFLAAAFDDDGGEWQVSIIMRHGKPYRDTLEPWTHWRPLPAMPVPAAIRSSFKEGADG